MKYEDMIWQTYLALGVKALSGEGKVHFRSMKECAEFVNAFEHRWEKYLEEINEADANNRAYREGKIR